MVQSYIHNIVIEFTAPSAPCDVTVRLVTPRVAEVSWRMPAVTNGVINRYIVYAIPLGGATRQRRQALAITTPHTIQTVYYNIAIAKILCILRIRTVLLWYSNSRQRHSN